jgi:hypothetical protein
VTEIALVQKRARSDIEDASTRCGSALTTTSLTSHFLVLGDIDLSNSALPCNVDAGTQNGRFLKITVQNLLSARLIAKACSRDRSIDPS